MIYILSCVWLDYMVQYFQCKNCVGSSPKTKKCVASFLVPVYTKSCEISYFTAFLQLFGEIYMDANRAFPANFGDFREYWPQSVRIRVMRERTL